MSIVAVFRHTRRGHQILLQMAVSRHVVDGNWTQDLWKSSQCTYLLSHLSSPTFFLKKDVFMLLCVWMLCLHMCVSVCVPHLCLLESQTLGLGMAGVAKGHSLGAGKLTWHLAGAASSLNPEPPLQPFSKWHRLTHLPLLSHRKRTQLLIAFVSCHILSSQLI